ncbi:MAG TPA: nuclear transport factor 2 family protein [Longimicrobiales bacterium]|nr:nuclear transport factor 2 family protein [Longimicrobiales bacterium]
MSIRFSRALLILVLAAAACRIERTPRVERDDPANVARDEIELTLRNYQEALLEGDARSAAAVFTPGAQVYLPETPVIAGRGEIDRLFANGMAGESIVEMDMQLGDIDVGNGVAHQFGMLEQTFRDVEGDEHDIAGRFAIRWVRAADSAWRIDRLIINHAPMDSAAAAVE